MSLNRSLICAAIIFVYSTTVAYPGSTAEPEDEAGPANSPLKLWSLFRISRRERMRIVGHDFSREVALLELIWRRDFSERT